MANGIRKPAAFPATSKRKKGKRKKERREEKGIDSTTWKNSSGSDSDGGALPVRSRGAARPRR
jgi:hypothetical protein